MAYSNSYISFIVVFLIYFKSINKLFDIAKYNTILQRNQMNPWINYHHLFYFKTIAEQGTVSKAAERLNIGQPTLSAQLKQFEESLGVSLFDRQHKKLLLSTIEKTPIIQWMKLMTKNLQAIHLSRK